MCLDVLSDWGLTVPFTPVCSCVYWTLPLSASAPSTFPCIRTSAYTRRIQPLSAVNGLRYQYAQVANKIGAKTIEKRILSSLEKDVQRLIEIGSLNLGTIKSCDKAQARLCFRPGVYIHVIYDPADPAFIGVYIGSSLCIGSRIKDHIEDLTAAQKYKNMGGKLERKKRRLNTVQMNFWSRRPGLRDFWLVFGQLEMQEGDNKEDLAVLLNILEVCHASFPNVTSSDLTNPPAEGF